MRTRPGQVLVRQAVGDRDFTAELNRAFSDHLKKLDIPHTFTLVPGVEHDALGLLKGLGEANWEFYRSVFGPAAAAQPRPSPTAESNPPPRKRQPSASSARKWRTCPCRRISRAARIMVGDKEREFFINIPASVKGKPAPVVFALHGGARAAAWRSI